MATVQFNLLPDVKLEYIKTQRSKKLIIAIATLASIVSVAIFLIIFLTVEGVQKAQLNKSNKDITTASNQLKAIKNLPQILTVQNQLTTLSSLHHQKHVFSRIFTYLPQVTPVNIQISQINFDTTTNAVTLSGTADAQTSVNTFIDTLKFTTYKVGSSDSAHQAFSSVVESSFSLNGSQVNFGVNFVYDPNLFSNDLPAVPTLTVPKLTTTRSVIEDPSNALFNQPADTTSTTTDFSAHSSTGTGNR